MKFVRQFTSRRRAVFGKHALMLLASAATGHNTKQAPLPATVHWPISHRRVKISPPYAAETVAIPCYLAFF
jgi:hypothetical protein